MLKERLTALQSMLSNGALVKEAAAEGGFTRTDSFSRQFKRYFNISPSKMRAAKSTDVRL
jgi:AraC-like DNA-binding protein